MSKQELVENDNWWKIAFLVGIISILLFIPKFLLSFEHSVGKYFPALNLIWCTDEISCLHEVGHHVDKLGGYISRTEEFQSAVDSYIQDNKDTCWEDCWMMEFPGVSNVPLTKGDGAENGWGGYGEMYANLYAYYRRADWLPTPEFRVFFDYTTVNP